LYLNVIALFVEMAAADGEVRQDGKMVRGE
jgi:hypothetical protein